MKTNPHPDVDPAMLAGSRRGMALPMADRPLEHAGTLRVQRGGLVFRTPKGVVNLGPFKVAGLEDGDLIHLMRERKSDD